MPTLGTHEPMTAEQIRAMFGDIPPERFLVHDWRKGVVKIGANAQVSVGAGGAWVQDFTGAASADGTETF